MVVRAALLLALLAVATLSGCIDDDSSGGGGGASLDDIPSGSAPTGENAGTPASHGNHARTESGVTVTRQGDQYVAKKTITLTNDFGGASAADVELTTVSGGVDAESWSSGGYEIVATLQARANTEQAARDNLARLKVVHSDRLGAGRLSLDTEVQFPSNVNGLSGGLDARLPAAPSYRLTGKTVSGGVSSNGLGGSVLTLDTTSGGVEVSGAFNTATLSTDSGGIEVDGVFNVLKATTVSGGIEADLEPTDSGSYDLETTSGGIQARLATGSGIGYDLEADLVSGTMSVNLPDSADVGTQSRDHRHVRTNGYDTRDVQVEVTLDTTSGGISVRGD